MFHPHGRTLHRNHQKEIAISNQVQSEPLHRNVMFKNTVLRCREQTYGHQGGKAGGRGGGGGMNWEIGIDIYTLICIK